MTAWNLVVLLSLALALSIAQTFREWRQRHTFSKAFRAQLEQLKDAAAIGARESAGSELPLNDTWPAGFDPAKHLGALRVVTVTNGHGGELVLKVRGGAFRVASFTRPTKFDPVSGEGDTTDLWLSIDELVKKVREPWAT